MTGGRNNAGSVEAKSFGEGVGVEVRQGDVMGTNGEKTGGYGYGGVSGPFGTGAGYGQRTENGQTDHVVGGTVLGGGGHVSSKDGVGVGNPADRVSGKK